MSQTRHLLKGEITYSVAQDEETNILHKLGYPQREAEFFEHLEHRRNQIQRAVSHHLNVAPSACSVSQRDYWMHGSFNVCIPVQVDGHGRIIIRFPLPYRVGEAFRPGNADEKTRCEAGAYAWLHHHCPDVPIPKLYGFGISTGETFTAKNHLPIIRRVFDTCYRQFLRCMGYEQPSQYVYHQCSAQDLRDLHAPYLVIEYIDQAQQYMLSNTWSEHRHDANLRGNLFRDLARILLSSARVPLPRVGSFVIDNSGFLTLTNRPLGLEIHDLENEDIPVDMPRDFTYTTVDAYVTDTLAVHDTRLRYQPNGVCSGQDGFYQMAALSMMRTIFPQFCRRDLRRGPFAFSLTDLHGSNIIVDDDWHIRCIIDLEWACSRPIEMIHPPRWLTDKAVDCIDAEEYDEVRKEFMQILREEEDLGESEGLAALQLSSIMERGWEMGTFWFALALKSPTGLFNVFYKHLQPRFAPAHEEDPAFYAVAAKYWQENMGDFLSVKIKDKEDYDERLRKQFE